MSSDTNLSESESGEDDIHYPSDLSYESARDSPSSINTSTKMKTMTTSAAVTATENGMLKGNQVYQDEGNEGHEGNVSMTQGDAGGIGTSTASGIDALSVAKAPLLAAGMFKVGASAAFSDSLIFHDSSELDSLLGNTVNDDDKTTKINNSKSSSHQGNAKDNNKTTYGALNHDGKPPFTVQLPTNTKFKPEDTKELKGLQITHTRSGDDDQFQRLTDSSISEKTETNANETSNKSIVVESHKTRCKETEKLLSMWIFSESQRQMHRLAHEYFAFRTFYFNFLPIGILTTITGVASFLSTSEVVGANAKDYLCVGVGVVSVLSVAIQSLAQESNYRARSELHLNASLGMKKLKDEIEFHLVDPSIDVDPSLKQLGKSKITKKDANEKRKTGNNTNNEGNLATITEEPPTLLPTEDDQQKKDATMEKKNIVETYRQISLQVLDSCKSTIPIKISQPFLLVDSRLALGLSQNERKELQKRHGYYVEQTIMGNWYNELFIQISNSRLWPLFVPKAEVVLEKSLSQVVNTFTKRSVLLSEYSNIVVEFKNTGNDPKYNNAKLFFHDIEWGDFSRFRRYNVDIAHQSFDDNHNLDWSVRDVDGSILRQWKFQKRDKKQVYEV